MKKIIRILLILCFIPLMNVHADGKVVIRISGGGSSVTRNVHYTTPRGDGDPESTATVNREVGSTSDHYEYYIPTIKYNGSLGGRKIEVTCVDPGVTLKHHYASCDPIVNDRISSIFENSASYNQVSRDFAIRFLAAQSGLTQGKYGMSAFTSSGWGRIKEVGGSSYVREAQSIVSSAGGSSSTPVAPDVDLTKVKFTAQFVSRDGAKVTAKVSAGTALTVAPNIMCTANCFGTVDVEWAPGASEGVIKFTLDSNGECEPQFVVTYQPSSGGLYKCVPSNESGSTIYWKEQTFLAYIPVDVISSLTTRSSSTGPAVTIGGGANDKLGANKAEFKLAIPGDVKKEICDGNKCGDDCNVSTEIKSNVVLCCSESTTSSVTEPSLNEIFCNLKGCLISSDGKRSSLDDNIDVPEAYDGKSSPYATDESEHINDYCQTYCTERAYVDLPGASNGRNGKYFQLTSRSTPSGETYGPYIHGNMSCRNIIYYNKWLKKYLDLTEQARDAFNSYQNSINSYYAYKDTLDEINNPGTFDVKGSASYSGSCTACGQSLGCSGTSEKTYKIHYEKKIDANYHKYDYRKVKINYDNNVDYIDKFRGLEIVDGGKESANGNMGGYYDLRWDSVTPSESDYPSKLSSETKTGVAYGAYNPVTQSSPIICESTCECTPSRDGVNLPKLEDYEIKPTYDGTRDGYNSAATGYKSIYDTLMVQLSQMKTDLELCDNYFISGKGSSTEYIKKKITENDISFEWFVAYVNFQSIVDSDEHVVDLKAKCNYSATGEYGSDSRGEGGVISPRYNHNDKTDAKIKNFNFGVGLECVSTNRTAGSECKKEVKPFIQSNREEYKQKYTSDTLYTYECIYQYPDNKSKYTVYPYGGFTEDDASNPLVWAYTKYDNREYIQHSTIYGTYQTKWTNLSIGSNGKFDQYFEQGNTCAKEANIDGVNFYCTMNVESDLVKIKGCPTSLVVTNENGSSNEWSKVCCEGGSCSTTVDDSLTYTFKIVDSTKLFAGTNRNSKDKYDSSNAPVGKDSSGNDVKYAYNWFGTNRGTGALKEIEDTSKDDKLYDPSRITYEFDLTSKAIKAIKDYNSYVNNYNEILNGQYSVTSPLVKKYYSNFIKDYYTTGVLKVDKKQFNLGIKPLGDSPLESARKKVHWDCYGEESSNRCRYIQYNN